MLTTLHTSRDVRLKVFPAHPSQPTYPNGWDDARRQEFVGPGTAKAKELGYLARTH